MHTARSPVTGPRPRTPLPPRDQDTIAGCGQLSPLCAQRAGSGPSNQPATPWNAHAQHSHAALTLGGVAHRRADVGRAHVPQVVQPGLVAVPARQRLQLGQQLRGARAAAAVARGSKRTRSVVLGQERRGEVSTNRRTCVPLQHGQPTPNPRVGLRLTSGSSSCSNWRSGCASHHRRRSKHLHSLRHSCVMLLHLRLPGTRGRASARVHDGTPVLMAAPTVLPLPFTIPAATRNEPRHSTARRSTGT